MTGNVVLAPGLEMRSGNRRGGARCRPAPAVATLLAAAALCVWLPAQAQCVLGGHPPCEASAALIVDCPDGVGSCLLVGDNEVRMDLFIYRLDGKGRPIGGARALRLDLDSSDELSDIEALTRSADGKLVVLGSHSRNSVCDPKKKRRRIGVVETLDEEPLAIEVHQSGKIRCSDLFVADARDEPLTEAVCQLIERTEDAAEAVSNGLPETPTAAEQAAARRRCNTITPYNAEGAVDIAAMGSSPNLWIGLRSPLLAAHPSEPARRELALLLHVHALEDYSFDGVAVLDLDGRGIRDLAIADGSVWLIAGPPQDLGADEEVPFQLRRFDAVELVRGAVIEPELVRDDLPTSSEGLAPFADQAIVVIDGDEGKGCGSACGRASRYLVLSLPAPSAAAGPGRPQASAE